MLQISANEITKQITTQMPMEDRKHKQQIVVLNLDKEYYCNIRLVKSPWIIADSFLACNFKDRALCMKHASYRLNTAVDVKE